MADDIIDGAIAATVGAALGSEDAGPAALGGTEVVEPELEQAAATAAMAIEIRATRSGCTVGSPWDCVVMRVFGRRAP